MSPKASNPGPSETQPLLCACDPPTVYLDEPRTTARSSDEESGDSTIADDDQPAIPKGSCSTVPFQGAILQGAIILLSLIAAGLLVHGLINTDHIEFDFGDALQKALGGGVSGAAGEHLAFNNATWQLISVSRYLAMVLQVLTLMPLRTVMNYQYRYGTTTTEAIKTLYADGGWTRYYQGLVAALIQGPVSRFGDTAANAGIIALLESNPFMKTLPTLIKTMFASVAAACFRMILTPIDTIKTAMQTEGKRGIALLRARVKKYGIVSLWYGALATAAASFVCHYPWFVTYNWLDTNLPLPTTVLEKVGRSALIGFLASIVCDSVSNSLFVVKTYRQVHASRIGYLDAMRAVIAHDGIKGLLGRGLQTRILTNGLQSIMFSVLWKLLMDLWNEKAS